MYMFTTLSLVAFATLIVATPAPRSPHLVKRHFWCNGVDSETICPEGQRMTPMDDYACGVVTSNNRLNDISPPENGQNSKTCPGQGDTQANVNEGPSNSTSTPPDTKTTPPDTNPTQPDDKSGGNTKAAAITTTTTHRGSGGKKIHLSCTKVDGVVGSWEVLNCTTTAAA